MMGYRTPNIDRLANEGAIFTDYYGQQSYGRPRRVHHGSEPHAYRPSKVGLPGAKEGLSEKDPTLAELLKPLGYMTGQFGRTISATVMNFYRPCMASMSSSVTFITSMPRTSRSTPSIPRTPSSN